MGIACSYFCSPLTVRFCTLAYGRDLAEAYEWCKKYQNTKNMKDLTQAWELYYHVFRRISKQLPQVHCCSNPAGAQHAIGSIAVPVIHERNCEVLVIGLVLTVRVL